MTTTSSNSDAFKGMRLYGYRKMIGTNNIFYRMHDGLPVSKGGTQYHTPDRLIEDINVLGTFSWYGKAPPGDYIRVDLEKIKPTRLEPPFYRYIPDRAGITVITYYDAVEEQKRNLLKVSEHSAGLEHDLVEFDNSLYGVLVTTNTVLKGLIDTLPTNQQAALKVKQDQITTTLAQMRRRLDKQTVKIQLLVALIPHLTESYRQEDDLITMHDKYLLPLAEYIEQDAIARANVKLVAAHPGKTIDEIRKDHVLAVEVEQTEHAEFNNVLAEWTKTYIPRSDFKTLSGFHKNVEEIPWNSRGTRKLSHHHWSILSIGSIKEKIDAVIAAEKAAEDEDTSSED